MITVSPPVSHSPSLVFSSHSLTLIMHCSSSCCRFCEYLLILGCTLCKKSFENTRKKWAAAAPSAPPLNPPMLLSYNIAKNLLRAVKRSVIRIIVLPIGRCRFLEENESGLRFRRNKIWRFTECTNPYNRPSSKPLKVIVQVRVASKSAFERFAH